MEFKEYNFNAKGHAQVSGGEAIEGHISPDDFEEMPTNNFMESRFWNFDALFQPQQHPACDSKKVWKIAFLMGERRKKGRE